MSADLNKDAPVASERLPPPAVNLQDLVKAGYPADAPCVVLRTINVPAGKSYELYSAVHLIDGFKEICEQNMFIQLQSIVVRFVPTKTGTLMAAGLTVNAASNAKISSINTYKTMIHRKATDLSMGAETHMLPLHTGMSTILRPSNIAGLYPFFALNLSGECVCTIEITYLRGGSAITTSEHTVA